MASIFFSRTFLRALLGIVLAMFVIAGAMWAIQAHASNNTSPVVGYAWSYNIGWIQFSGSTTANSKFGVKENMSTGALSGYAWSSNIGWISFNGTKVNLANGILSGYAQACSAFADKNKCSGALDPNSGGWDGLIHLSGTATNGKVYKVTQNSDCTWSGYAWGSNVIGSVHMNGTGYGVKVQTNLSCKTALQSSPPSGPSSYCPITTTGTITASPNRIPSKNTPVTLTWNISGLDSSSFASAQCKIVKNGDLAKGTSITNGAVFSVCNASGTLTETVSSQTIYALYCGGVELNTSTNVPAETVINVAQTFSEF